MGENVLMELDLYYDPDRIYSEFDSVASPCLHLFLWEICLYDLLMGFWERSANVAMTRFIALHDKQEEILELGTGTGHLLSLLVKKFPQSKITGVDYSKKMIEMATKYLSQSNPQTNIISAIQHYEENISIEPHVRFIHCNCFDLPKEKQKYDLIVSSFLFDIQTPHCLNKLLDECASLIRTDGSIFIAVLDNSVRHPCRQRLSRSYFSLTNRIYEFCYRSKILRRISQQVFFGYYTHCRPVDIEHYVKNIPGLKISRQTASSIRILGIPFLPVKIVEIVKT